MLTLYLSCDETQGTDDDFRDRIEVGIAPTVDQYVWMNPDTRVPEWRVFKAFNYRSEHAEIVLAIVGLKEIDALDWDCYKYKADYPKEVIHLLIAGEPYRAEYAMQGDVPRIGEVVAEYETIQPAIETPYGTKLGREIPTDLIIESFDPCLPIHVAAPYQAIYLVHCGVRALAAA